MKKTIYLASLLLVIQNSSAQPSIPAAFTVVHEEPLPEIGDRLLSQEKAPCFFYILVSTPLNSKIDPARRKAHYKTFMAADKNHTGPVIPQGFIKPGVPSTDIHPTYCLHFEWEDRGGKNNLMDSASVFTKSMARLHQNFKKNFSCEYLIATEGRSGLLVNYATHLLKKETFSFSVVTEIGTPLPETERGQMLFYPNLAKVGTFYSFYTQHKYMATATHFPPSPRTSYPREFVHRQKNLFNIRLLINNNQQSLQNIFERRDMKLSTMYLGQHIFEFCNFIKHSKRSYQEHRDIWATLDTRTGKKPFVGIVSHPAQEKNFTMVKQEHQRAGRQLDEFQKTVGSQNRIEMSEGQQTRSVYRPLAHTKKLEKFACQTA